LRSFNNTRFCQSLTDRGPRVTGIDHDLDRTRTRAGIVIRRGRWFLTVKHRQNHKPHRGRNRAKCDQRDEETYDALLAALTTGLLTLATLAAQRFPRRQTGRGR